MKNFWQEFKKFISRGNVIDLAVGVIIGGAFTAIVTALTTNILQPVINWVIALIFGGSAQAPVYTVLRGVYLEGGALDTVNSIYIDWGAFISAIINFLLIALVLFIIIRVINKVNENNEKLKQGIVASFPSRQDVKEMKKLGINYRDSKEVKKFKEAKAEQLKAEKEKAEKEAKEKEEEAKKHTTEGLLEQIKAILESNSKK